MSRTDTDYRVLGVLAVALAVLFASSGVSALQVDAPDRPSLPRVPFVPSVLGAPVSPFVSDAPLPAASDAHGPISDDRPDRGTADPLPTTVAADAPLDPALAARADAYVAAYNRGVTAAPAEIRERYAGDLRTTVAALSAYEAGKRQVATETVRFEVREAGGELAVVTVRTDAEARVVEHYLGDRTAPTPTVVVRTDEATLRRTAGAADPVAAGLDAVADGDVTISGPGVDPVALRNLVELYRLAG
jgi:hypothetical protein